MKETESHKKLADKIVSELTPSFPSPSEWLGIKSKVEDLAERMHQRALTTPDPNDDNIDFLELMRNYVDGAPITAIMPNWFKDIVIYLMASFNEIAHSSVQYVFKHLYKIITEVVLYTPQWIFDNDWFPLIVSKYSSISVLCIALVAIIEGIRKMLRLSNTPFGDVLKKLPIALGISAATPYLFSNGLKLLNKLTDIIISLSADEIDAASDSIFAISLAFEPLNIIMMILFLVIVIALCVPMILFHARRWFDLTVLGVLTPLAMCSWIFETTQNYFHMWLRSIKDRSLIQLIYAVFISILGIIMFATPNPTTLTGVFSKLLICVGGIHALAFPPQFIKRFNDTGDGMFKRTKDLKEYGEDKIDEVKKLKTKGEDILVESARIAGKGVRFIFRRK